MKPLVLNYSYFNIFEYSTTTAPMSKFKIAKGTPGQEFIRLERSKHKIELKVKAYTFADGDFEVALVPSLSISAYGRDRKSAMDMLQEAMNDYIDKLIIQKQEIIDSDLSKHGWTKQKFHSRNFDGPFIDKAGILRDFNLPEGTELKEQMILS